MFHSYIMNDVKYSNLAKQCPAVNNDLAASHVAGHIAGQKKGGFADLVRLAHAMHRDFNQESIHYSFHINTRLGWALHFGHPGRSDTAWSNSVNPNFVARQLQRYVFGKAPKSVFGSIVMGQTNHRRMQGVN